VGRSAARASARPMLAWAASRWPSAFRAATSPRAPASSRSACRIRVSWWKAAVANMNGIDVDEFFAARGGRSGEILLCSNNENVVR
jgi:hypothetical protein